MIESHLTEDVDQTIAESQPHTCSKHDRGWRKVVRHFTQAWFSVNMGTGIVAILLNNLPYNGEWLYWLSVVVFAWNVFLFCTFLCISILRYSLYPEIWSAMIRHPSASMFLGTFPIGLATIIEMVALVCVPAWGPRAANLAWALWWIDCIIALAICYYIPFVIMCVHDSNISTVTAVWLLPIASSVVASARLMLHNLPPREAIMSVFLPIAPLGLGSFAIMQFGRVALKIFPETGTLSSPSTNAGAVLYIFGWLIGLVMWAYGIVWIFFALASISRNRFPFNLTWWGFTFPLGVFASATTTIGKELPSRFFNVLGTGATNLNTEVLT
ncbi:hypothetical protein N7481_000253 [Penicillium waksmanii]|uniref:uncharacterized protein n=1 Tax=Penicillium waksmanii TaxID=69791 RepID=UPI002547A257|nr:uncharacterized protein N7481_000253 [Penicillium waksmanii]KAJ5999844.1 hypothetical protein N7481_000253 [Penicillium waksmanii]